jgi:hypothetical protein
MHWVLGSRLLVGMSKSRKGNFAGSELSKLKNNPWQTIWIQESTKSWPRSQLERRDTSSAGSKIGRRLCVQVFRTSSRLLSTRRSPIDAICYCVRLYIIILMAIDDDSSRLDNIYIVELVTIFVSRWADVDLMRRFIMIRFWLVIWLERKSHGHGISVVR